MTDSINDAIDSVTEELITHDPEIRKMIKHLAIQSIRVKLHYLNNGTPEMKLRAASGMDGFIKAVTTPRSKDEEGAEAKKLYDKTRSMLMNVIPVDGDEDDDN